MTDAARPTTDVVALASRFPEGFLFGVATASYQIEGAVDEDGRAPSIWDIYSHTPGRVDRDEHGDVAIDHYHRWRDDIELMRDLGLRAYRFSIAWPRIVPDGDGEVEPRGLAHYRNLVRALRDAGIEPVVTLYHWDLPQALQDRGGWANRATADAFARYARIVQGELGEDVAIWMTLNEPWCSAFLGYGSGVHAPGITDPRAAFRAAHHLLLGHGQAVRAMREQAGDDHRFGIVPNLYGALPATDSPDDLRAAATLDALQNRLWLDTVLRGSYPDEVAELMVRFRADDAVLDGDAERIATPIDLLGVNYYSQHHVRGGQGASPLGSAHPGTEHVVFDPPAQPLTEMGWSVEPHGLRDLLLRLDRDYDAPPIIICENGVAYDDKVDDDGQIRDDDRRQFIEDHLTALAEAIEAGVDVRGYLLWTLIDNFEWARGYDKRFGIVRADPVTLDRTVKLSGRWYRDLIAAAP